MSRVEPAPRSETMDENAPLENDLSQAKLCCPSCLGCIGGVLCPWMFCCSCQQVNEKQELVFLNFGKFLGVLRKPGLYCRNPCGSTAYIMSTAVQSIEIPHLKVVDVKGNPLLVSGVVMFRIMDSRKAALNVRDWNKCKLLMKLIYSRYTSHTMVASRVPIWVLFLFR